MSKIPPGIARNNPGNIERVKGVIWEGQRPKQTGRFVTFEDAISGLRAIAKTLVTYADARKARDGSKIDTVREVIDRWAPPTENDTAAYSKHIASRLRVGPDEILDIKNHAVMRELVVSIVLHENGQQPYTMAQVDEALRRVGIVRLQKPISKDYVVTATGTAATLGVVAQSVSQVEQIWTSLQSFHPLLPHIVVGVAGAVGIIVLAVLFGRRLFDRRQGIH